MFKTLVSTPRDWTLLVIRVTLGLVIFAHGAQKLFGWFGGYGLDATIGFFTQNLGIPLILALLVILFESLGAVALIAGLLSRLAAAGIAIIMVVATLTVHLQNGFFMNWSGNQPGEGFEFHLLALALALAVVIKGAGSFSLDRKLAAAAA